MSSASRGSIGFIVLLSTLGMSAASHAQGRPTLEGVESRVNVLENEVTVLETELDKVKTSACTAADLRGETYRPGHCDARCDCLDSGVTEIAACTVETGGGSTTYEMDITFESQTCTDPFGVGLACYDDASACATSADCTAPYDQCLFNMCSTGTGCNLPSDCPAVLTTISDYWVITQNGTADSDVASCQKNDPVNPAAITTNHKDSVECIAQVEAHLGQPCTPVP